MIKLYSYRIAALASAILGSFGVSGVAFGQTVTAPTNIITSPSDVVTILCGILTWMFWGAMVFSVAMFLYGGYMYAASAGSSEMVNKANKTLMFAAIGVVIALVAYGIPIFIGSFLGVSAGSLKACG